MREEKNGKKVLLITDIIRTGKTIRETIQCITEAGGDVVEVRCVWNCLGITEMEIIDPSGCRIASKELMVVPIMSIINDSVESWEPDECPLCEQRRGGLFSVIPLTNPKTGECL